MNFGLVYLEAMAASCITIASKYGGVDGIIENNKNGFLCSEGDFNELNSIINDIVGFSEEKISEISENGYKTALKYSDSEVSKKYLDTIIQYDSKGDGNGI